MRSRPSTFCFSEAIAELGVAAASMTVLPGTRRVPIARNSRSPIDPLSTRPGTSRVEPLGQLRGERNGGDDRCGAGAGADEADERDRRLDGARRHAADGEAVRRLDPQRRGFRQEPLDCATVPCRQGSLERGIVAEALARCGRALPLVIERGESGVQPRLEAVVDAACDAPLRNRAEAPKGSGQRHHGQRQERPDQLDLEAPQHFLALQLPRPLPIRHVGVFSAGGGSSMRLMFARALTVALAVLGGAGAMAFPKLIIGEAIPPKEPATFAAPPQPDSVPVIRVPRWIAGAPTPRRIPDERPKRAPRPDARQQVAVITPAPSPSRPAAAPAPAAAPP